MKSIDGFFTWGDYHMEKLFEQWQNEGTLYCFGGSYTIVYCPSQPRLSYVEIIKGENNGQSAC